MITPAHGAAKIPLLKHVEAFVADMEARGLTEGFATLTEQRLRRLLADCSWVWPRDFEAGRLSAVLAGYRKWGMSVGM